MSDIYKQTRPGKFSDIESPERLREILRELELARGALGVRVEVLMDVKGPRIIITASSEAAEQRIAEQLAPYVVEAINQTFGALVEKMTAAMKEEEEPRR